MPIAEGSDAPEIQFVREVVKKRKGRVAGQPGKKIKLEDAREDEGASEVTFVREVMNDCKAARTSQVEKTSNIGITGDDDFDEYSSILSDDIV